MIADKSVIICVRFIMRNRRRQQVEYKKKISRLVSFTIGVLILIYLSLSLVFSESGFLRYMKLESAKTGLMAEVRKIKKQNKEIEGHIDLLKKDPDLIEEIAREQGLTKEGEWVFKYEDEE